MALTIKTRIASGIGLLFSLLAIISVLSLIAINLLSGRTENLLTTNYKTIRYCNAMMHAMDDMQQNPAAVTDFEKALTTQESNITESGEHEATAQVRRYFELLKNDPENPSLEDSINSRLYSISQLNQSALERKNALALKTADNARLWLTMLITLMLVVGLSLAFNLPGIVVTPVKQLTEGIREIAKGNYKARIHLNNQDDEFGQMAQAFNGMAGRLDEWENSSMARLLFEKGRVDTIINQMEDAVIGTDGDNRVLFVNHAAAALYGLPADEVVGQQLADVAARNELLQTVLNGRQPGALTVAANGKEQFFTLTRKAVHAEGKSLGEVYTLKNVTHFKELDLSKTNLLATLSHELKTPISSIKMSAKLLEDERIGSLNNEQLEMVGSITDDTERLLRLTAELLSITQIETGNIQLKIARVQPEAIVGEAVAAVAMQAQAKRISIQQSASPTLPAILADASKAELVLVNLLTNAIRYSPEGTRILLNVRQDDKRAVRFEVQDEGEGIDPRYQGRIFDRYFKVPGNINKTGTGLGLAISKEFIEAQGGEIGVLSEPEKGSRFYFTLPSA